MIADRKSAWMSAIDASKVAAIDAFSDLENPIHELINMSFILQKMIVSLEVAQAGPVKLETTDEEWNAVCFVATKINEMTNGLNDRYLVGHKLACDYEQKFVEAYMAKSSPGDRDRSENAAS